VDLMEDSGDGKDHDEDVDILDEDDEMEEEFDDDEEEDDDDDLDDSDGYDGEDDGRNHDALRQAWELNDFSYERLSMLENVAVPLARTALSRMPAFTLTLANIQLVRDFLNKETPTARVPSSARDMLSSFEQFLHGVRQVSPPNRSQKKKKSLSPPLAKTAVPTTSSLGESSADPVICCICQDALEEGQKVQITFCHHGFHSHCSQEWFNLQKSCPTCRMDLSAIADMLRWTAPTSVPTVPMVQAADNDTKHVAQVTEDGLATTAASVHRDTVRPRSSRQSRSRYQTRSTATAPPTAMATGAATKRPRLFQ